MDVDDIVEEILCRLPPDDPASLARAALVCKRWYRLVTDPHCRRRFRRFHRSAPMLGVFSDGAIINGRFFVSTTSFRPPSRRDFVRDARHGRVLLQESWPRRTGFVGLVVWDPITNKQRQLPDLPRQWLQHDTLNWNTAVLCAATADRTCDHLECHHGHFLVVFVASTFELVQTCVYSSKSGAWSNHSSALLGGCRGVTLGPCALVGSALYFDTPDKSILKYDLGTNKMSLIGVPSECWHSRKVPTAMEDGGLGFACVKCNPLHLVEGGCS
ncbi:uncharacterized protein LOC101754341 [Setaria italica]|uniref:uncharacterized protein LOC101754341 n=1 Tax=Setaria italica TaxID=4555 RepID=UPI0006457D4F|nr:uncharacterized protein LOC101754341 [Setaria italica]